MKAIQILILIVLFISCNHAEKDKNVATLVTNELPEAANSINEVKLALQPNIFKLTALPDTMALKMINLTPDTIFTGLHYRIEFFENKHWKEISPANMLFHDIGYSIAPVDFKVFQVRLLTGKITYPPGRYRIVKHYFGANFAKTKESHDIYAEFNIVPGTALF